jgi:ABC-type transport system involved in multi-copper enzyme maturation permease subunit
MDAPQAKPLTYNRWLPYWAVFQADCGATLRSWVYRAWVAVCVLALTGYLVYRLGPYHEAGIVPTAGHYLADLARWLVLGSVALIGILTASAISGERGTVADSVLSRGISRYQYYMGKWHARIATIVGTYLLLAAAALAAAYFLLKEELSIPGCLMALAVIGALLVAVISLGVAISAISNSTVMGIAVLWLVLYGMGFILACLPETVPAPDRVLKGLPFMLRGYFDIETQGYLILWAMGLSVVTAIVGMVWFSRKDV